MIADSHCHLDFESLYKDLDKVIDRAKLNDVKYMLTICTTLNSFEKIKLIIDKYKNIYGTFGIHPHETSKNEHVNADFIIDIKKKYNKIIGIGESGLDFYYNISNKTDQKKSFLNHIHAATNLKIPLIVHSRNAEKDTYDILKSEMKNSPLKVLMHCFTGSKDFAKKLLDINCYFSISGIVTFKNATDLVDVVSFLPLKSLLVETDSPYLAPLPYRGKNNEPSFIVHTLQKMSEIKKIPMDKMASTTTDNFKKLFNL